MRTNYPTFSEKDLTEANFKKVVLERLQLKIKHGLDKFELKNDVQIDSYMDYVADRVVFEFKTEILGEKDKKEVKIPSSWWQMFKQEYLPQWFLKRFPVQSKYIGMFDYTILYPHLKVSLPNERRYVCVTSFEPFNVEEDIKKDYKKLLI